MEGDGKPREKKPRPMPKYTYKKRSDGRPPEMSQIHVDFARLSADYIRSKPNAHQKELIQNFNSSATAKRGYLRVRTGNQGTGRADNFFFNNGYFKIEDLRQIANGRDLMPVPLRIDPDGREYSL